MSQLFPGGSRHGSGIYDARQIRDHCRRNKRDDRNARNSIADKRHEHKREIARNRRRQAASRVTR